MTAQTGRAVFRGGNPVLVSTPSKETLLQPGTRVRLLQDHVTLKKGAEGECVGVYGWIGSTQVTVSFSFNHGNTRFNTHPAAVAGLIEVIP